MEHFITIVLWTLIFGTLPSFTNAVPCEGAATDGLSYTFKVSTTTPRITWSYFDGSSNITVMTCWYSSRSATQSCDGLTEQYTGRFAKLADGGYEATLTINVVNRDTTIWKWDYEGRTIGLCELTVYAPLPKPVCIKPYFSDGNILLHWQCGLKNIDTLPKCEFSWSLDDGDYQIKQKSLQSTKNKNWVLCNIIGIPVRTLRPGFKYRFKMRMFYPDDAGLGNSTESSPLTFRLPKVEITDCPAGDHVNDGYIKVNTYGTCLCSLSDPGYPQGTPGWTDRFALEYLTSTLINSTTSQLAGIFKNDDYQSYDCKGTSTLGEGKSLTFMPKVSYGPTADDGLKITVAAPTFTKCGSTSSFAVLCDTRIEAANPKANVYVQIKQGASISEFKYVRETQPSFIFRYTFEVYPPGSGVTMLKCVATNPLFPEIGISVNKRIEVFAPPPDPPVFIIDGKSISPTDAVVKVVNGSDVSLKCRVHGGYPDVSTVSVMCGGLVIDTSQVIRITPSFDKVICACKAHHETKCYTKTTQVVLDIISNDGSGNKDDQISEEDEGLGVGVIVGIVIAGCVVACVLCFVIGMKVQKLRIRKRHAKEEAATPTAPAQQPTDPSLATHSGFETYDHLELPVTADFYNDNHQTVLNREEYECLADKNTVTTPTGAENKDYSKAPGEDYMKNDEGAVYCVLTDSMETDPKGDVYNLAGTLDEQGNSNEEIYTVLDDYYQTLEDVD